MSAAAFKNKMVTLFARKLHSIKTTARMVLLQQQSVGLAINHQSAKCYTLPFSHGSRNSGLFLCHRQPLFITRTNEAGLLSSNFSSSGKETSYGSSPYEVLGVPESSTYENVKQEFLKLAKLYHPDKTPKSPPLSSSPNAQEEYVAAQEDKEKAKKEEERRMDQFNLIRAAFESLAENEDGRAVLRHEVENEIQNGTARIMTPEELDDWFYSNSGLRLPSYVPDLDPRVTRDLAKRVDKEGSLGRSGEAEWWLAWLARQGTREEPLPRVTMGGVFPQNTSDPGNSRKIQRKKKNE